jgi:hypothetical protein
MRISRSAIAVVLTLATTVLAPQAARAQAQAQAASAPGLQISVEPLVVQFSLAPGGQTSTPVTIKNVGTAKAAIDARQIDWRTTLDGSVKTERPGSEGPLSLDPELRLSDTQFTLAPGETRTLVLSLVLPPSFSAEPRDYRGGYLVRATPFGSPTTQAFGVGANILTYETVGAPSRHLKLTSLKVVDAGDHSVQFTARMQNDGRTFVRPQIRMTVAQGGRIVQQREDSTPAIFGGDPRLYTRTLRDLPSGNYQLQLSVDYGGATLIEGTTDFTVR